MKNRTPKLVITSEHWANEAYVMFDDEKPRDMWGESWVGERLQIEQNENNDITEDDVVEMMTEEFCADNSEVERVLDGENILLTDEGYWYEYNDDGMCRVVAEGDITQLREHTHGSQWANCTLYISAGSCNGEEVDFEKYVNVEYPEIKTVIGLRSGFYNEDDEEINDPFAPNFWDEYCDQ